MSPLSASELERFAIATGRGYDRQAVERFRTEALRSLAHLERRLDEVLAEQQHPLHLPSVRELAGQLTPEVLQEAGLAAIGLALSGSVVEADRIKAEAARQANEVLRQAAARLRAADSELAAAGPAGRSLRAIVQRAYRALIGSPHPPAQKRHPPAIEGRS